MQQLTNPTEGPLKVLVCELDCGRQLVWQEDCSVAQKAAKLYVRDWTELNITAFGIFLWMMVLTFMFVVCLISMFSCRVLRKRKKTLDMERQTENLLDFISSYFLSRWQGKMWHNIRVPKYTFSNSNQFKRWF